jgi:integrase
VDVIRSSSRSSVSLARELGVSDTLIRKVRRGELWNGVPAPRNRNDVPRRVVIDTLILGGLRVSELCGLDGPHLDIAAGRLRIPRSATKSDAGERNIPIVPALRQELTELRTKYPSGRASRRFQRATARASTRTTSVHAFSRRSVSGQTSSWRPRVCCPSAT